MKYDIYFHGGCFDGVASAAMLLWFLRQRGDSYGKFIPLTHPVNKKWWKSLKMQRPSAITDILYHPKAKIWFDHHPTTFIDKKWEKNFKKDGWHVLDTKSPSCTGLIYRHLTKVLKIKPPKYIKELAYWADILDGKLFLLKSPAKVFDFRIPALRVFYSIHSGETIAYQKTLINALSNYSLEQVARSESVRSRFSKHKAKFKKSLPLFRKSIAVKDNVIVVDDSKNLLRGMKFMEYKYYPKLPYSVRILKRGNIFALDVGENPWHLSNKVHIGNFLRKNFGGGGHQYVGGAQFKTKGQALKAAEKTIEYLNKHG